MFIFIQTDSESFAFSIVLLLARNVAPLTLILLKVQIFKSDIKSATNSLIQDLFLQPDFLTL